jgi:hypothetical protein
MLLCCRHNTPGRPHQHQGNEEDSEEDSEEDTQQEDEVMPFRGARQTVRVVSVCGDRLKLGRLKSSSARQDVQR